MLKAARICATLLLFVDVVAMCLRVPPTHAEHFLTPAFGPDRLPTLYSRTLTEGYSLAAAISHDGRAVATLLSLPPGTPILLPQALTLQIWDAVTLRLVLSREIPVRESSLESGAVTGNVQAPYDCFIRYSSNGAFLVFSDVSGELHVLDARDLKEIRSISLGLSETHQSYGPIAVEVSPSGDRVAVAFSAPTLGKNSQSREVRVFNLDTGRLLWKVNFEGDVIGGIAWSPDGYQIALTLPAVTQSGGPLRPDTNRGKDDLFVLDSSSGRVLSKFNTGDLTGPICFGPDQEVFTAPAHSVQKGGPHESVKVWDVRTGTLKRKIGYQGRDVYDTLGLSKDGRVLMGYIGKVGSKLDVLDMARYSSPLDQRFAIWDARNGRLIADSPNLMPSKGSPGYGATSALRLELSADGGAVLVSSRAVMAKAIVFDVPEIPSNH
jgi:WD40 repeat protein